MPARRAARLTPLEGMSGVAPEDSEEHSWRQTVIGLGMWLVSVALLVACLAGWLSPEHSVIVIVMLLISLVLLLPLVLRPLTWLSQWLMQPLVRVEARLARRQLLRHSGRTTLTIGVLFVAVGTGLGLANSVVDNVEDVRHWYRTAIVGDFFVHAQMPDMETGLSAAVPEVVGEQIQQVAGITRLASVRLIAATANKQHVIVMAMRKEFPAEPDTRIPHARRRDDRQRAGAANRASSRRCYHARVARWSAKSADHGRQERVHGWRPDRAHGSRTRPIACWVLKEWMRML